MFHYVPSILKSTSASIFPLARDLSGDAAINSILADIPFFAVGVLGFCTLPFFALMKRLNLLSTYLHASILAAFIASIFDLSLTLSIGSLNTDSGLRMKSASGIIIAREIGFTVAVVLRLLFFWTFVAEPPRHEAALPLSQYGLHSAAWSHWGFFGSMLRLSTLAMISVVFVLQLIWRIAKDLNVFSPVYNAGAAIELTLSAVFILKLGLNTWLCTVVPKWMTMLSYFGFALALIFSIGIALGNLVSLKFTDSILGRFLQALEFYILVLSALLATFHPYSSIKVKTDDVKRVPSPILIPPSRESSLQFAPPIASIPHLPPQAALGPDIDNKPSVRALRRNYTSRISLWLASRDQRFSGNFQTHQQSDQVQFWNHNEAERGQVSIGFAASDIDMSMGDQTNGMSSPASTDYVEVDSQSRERASPPAAGFNGRSTVSTLMSWYSEIGTPQVYSPAFGLDGIVDSIISPILSPPPESRWLSSSSNRPTSDLSNLFRQQNELEKSINALRLFDNTTEKAQNERKEMENSPRGSLYISDNWSKGYKLESSLASSEMSSSGFPQPVWRGEAKISGVDLRARPSRRDGVIGGGGIAVGDVPFNLAPPRTPAVVELGRQLSVPYSKTDSELPITTRTPKFDSQVTRYNTSSSVGDVTTPSGRTNYSASTRLTGINSENETSATIVTMDKSPSVQYSRAMYLGPPLNSASQAVNQVGIGRGLAGPQVGPPQRPRWTISTPQLKTNSDIAETTPGIFESPRPTPLVLRYPKKASGRRRRK